MSKNTLGMLYCMMPNALNCGLYAIRNTVTGKAYYGSSGDIASRWSQHRTHLRGRRHANRHLQNAWTKYGEAAFAFSVLCVLEHGDLRTTEQRLLALAVGQPDCYNIACDAWAGMRGRKHTPETRAKIAQAGRTRVYGPTKPETKEKMAAAKRGKKQSPETIATRAAKQIGRKHTAEARAKMSVALRGKMFSPERRARMSAARKGYRWTPETIARRSAAQRGLKRSLESIAKWREARKGWRPTVEAVERMRLTKIGKKQSPETIAKRVAKNKGKKRSPEVRAKMVAAWRVRRETQQHEPSA